MPNFRGLDVLEYECDIMRLQNLDDEIKISTFKDVPYLSQDDKERMIELYQSFINKRSAKIETYSNMISGYLKDHDSTSSYVSYEPLEDLYQEFLNANLKIILQQIENFFENYRDALLQDSIVHFSLSAKKVAIHSLSHHVSGDIVQKYLHKKKIKELESTLVTTEKSKSAIREKYDYYSDRIQHCLEIGNKIRELSQLN